MFFWTHQVVCHSWGMLQLLYYHFYLFVLYHLYQGNLAFSATNHLCITQRTKQWVTYGYCQWYFCSVMNHLHSFHPHSGFKKPELSLMSKSISFLIPILLSVKPKFYTEWLILLLNYYGREKNTQGRRGMQDKLYNYQFPDSVMRQEIRSALSLLIICVLRSGEHLSVANGTWIPAKQNMKRDLKNVKEIRPDLTLEKPSFQTQKAWFHSHIMSKTH